MVYVMATKENFEAANIPITTEIQLNNKYIKHIEHLTAEQIDYIRFKQEFDFVDEINMEQPI